MPKPIPATSYPLLISLINETYFDKVEQISAAEVDDGGDIVCVALDGRKKLAVKVENDNINIKLMGGAVAVNAVKFTAPAKKKTCSKGISCGIGCISATKVCRKKTTPSQKAKKKLIAESAKEGQAQPTNNTDAPKALKVLSSDQEHLVNLNVSADDESRMEKIMTQHPEITTGEAAGFAAYIGNHFSEMNMSFWDRENFELTDPEAFRLADARATGAAIALKKMPVVTRESLADATKSHIKASPTADDGLLTHSMTLDDPDKFMKQFKVGEEIGAGKFLSASWAEGGHSGFAEDANVEFKIKPKLNGDGAGRLVDQYKNFMFEDEILYPPDTKFKVTKIEKKKGNQEVSELISVDVHTEKHEALSRIAGNLSHALDLGVSPSFAKKLMFSDSGWKDVNKVHGLPAYPKTKGDAKSYLYKINLLMEEEAKKKKSEMKKIIIEAATPDKYVVHKEEI
jgi:hypothetical protein